MEELSRWREQSVARPPPMVEISLFWDLRGGPGDWKDRGGRAEVSSGT